MNQSFNQQYRATIVRLAQTASKDHLVQFMIELCTAYQDNKTPQKFHEIVQLGTVIGCKEMLEKEKPKEILESFDRMIKGNEMLNVNKFKS